jgi:uncharacterized repeat protein (TIGR03803 family)
LYGTAIDGGANGWGSVFGFPAGGIATPLYSFTGGSDGGDPLAGVVSVGGALYGTTSAGGGTVFKITLKGKERVLHAFTGTPDGNLPEAGLLDVDGTLYGTTTNGGATNNGTVFSITP